MFHILIHVLVMWVFRYVKIQQTTLEVSALQFVQFILQF